MSGGAARHLPGRAPDKLLSGLRPPDHRPLRKVGDPIRLVLVP
ncbi:hypothetical protein ACFV7R_43590 [Streptomyces sp. NPDC059866]